MRIVFWDFAPSLWPTLAVLLILPLFLSLGFWQLDRAEQKSTALALQDQGAAQPAVNLASVSEAGVRNYLKVYVEGEWSEELFL